MWLLIHSLSIWKKYAFYLLLVTTLVGCATPANDDYPMERDPYDRYYQETGFPYYGDKTGIAQDFWREEEYEAGRNNQPEVNTSQGCDAQDSCKQFKPR